MNHTSITKRIAALLLVFCTLFSVVELLPASMVSFGTVYAEGETKVTITGSVVNVRSGAGTSYSKLTTVKKNAVYTSLGTAKDSSGTTWYKISANGCTGYVSGAYVKVTTTTSSTTAAATTQTLTVTGSNVNVRKGAGTGYARVATAQKGSVYTVLGSEKDSSGKVWYKISINGTTGYIINTYVSVSTATTAATTTTTTQQTAAATQTLTVTGTNVNVRKGAGTGYAKVATAQKGTVYTVLGSEKDSSGKVWYKININGTTGYIISTYVSVSTTTTAATTTTTTKQTAASAQQLTVTGTNVNVRKGAGTGYTKVATAQKDAVYTVLGSEKDSSGKVWYKISINGTTGYIISTYVSVSTVTAATTTTTTTAATASTTANPSSTAASATTTTTSANVPEYVTVMVSSANIRSGAGESYSVKATAAYGTVFSVLSRITDSYGKVWYRIIVNDVAGYISISDCVEGAVTTTTKTTTGTTKADSESVGGSSSSGITVADSYDTGIVNLSSGTLAVRSGAGTSYSKLGELVPNSKVLIVDSDSSWYKILYSGGYGWVSQTYISNVQNETLEAILSFPQSYYYINVGDTFNANHSIIGLPLVYKTDSANNAPVNDEGVIVGTGAGVYDVEIICGTHSASTVLVICKEPNSNVQPMTISDEGIAFIAAWEGGATEVDGEKRFYPYQDVSGYWTVGYGHAITDSGSTSWSAEKAIERFNSDISALLGEEYVAMSDSKNYLTSYEAETLLKADLIKAGYNDAVSDWAVRNGVILNQAQHDALVSFCYNLGKSYFTNDNVKFYLKSAIISMRNGSDADPDQIIDGFTRYIKSKGVNYKGLYYRRMNEAELFISGDYEISRNYVLPNITWG